MIVVDRNKCPHDHRCPLMDICPEEAISQGDDGYPIIDYTLCIECGICIKRCPLRAIKQLN
jgi:ferredoxin